MNIVSVMQASSAESTRVEALVGIQHAVEPIALNRLVPSKANVRRVNAAVGVSELADSIEAHGLIHNLTVRKAKKGRYEVIAGSRRPAFAGERRASGRGCRNSVQSAGGGERYRNLAGRERAAGGHACC
ncbi:MAG: ParB/RepB/Spo0J family partition protein [Agrobacterium sp.]|uniref:ParB/RepB/Spo0J family partition protein n=1 Tax=Agrobacterium sp. TaxID=361 RepID=UPI0040378021